MNLTASTGRSMVARMVIGGLVIGGVAGGAMLASVSAVADTRSDDPERTVTERAVPGPEETWGSHREAAAPGNASNLILAQATNGASGYVVAEDLYGPTPTSPAEAIALNAFHAEDRTINVYDADGTTVVGAFVVTGAIPVHVEAQ